MSASDFSGRVALVHRESCHVLLEGGSLRPCTVRGRVMDRRGRLGNAVVVGDEVRGEALGEGGVIDVVLPRRNAFHRRAAGGRAAEQVVAANVDLLVLVAAAAAPPFREGLVDRVLAQAEQCAIPALLALNKIDRVDPEAAEALLAPYRAAGYDVLPLSARQGVGIASLEARCRGRRALFVGHSGVGKSTVLNALSPGLGLRVGELNPKTLKGRHTTSAAWLRRVPPDLEVIDTPGVRSFALWGVDPRGLDRLFREFVPFLGGCRYSDCRHLQEPGCAVLDAVGRGAVTPVRYDSYLKLREELLRDAGGARR